MLGPNDPAWKALRKELDALVKETGAIRAAVVDESKMLWCWSSPSPTATAEEDDAEMRSRAEQFHEAELSEKTLRLGRHLSVVRREKDASYAAESFANANTYVLVVWCHAMFPVLSTQTAIRDALAKIEPLTLALPKPGAPDASIQRFRL